jgi:capsular exopolysaccharide synthesis family protein
MAAYAPQRRPPLFPGDETKEREVPQGEVQADGPHLWLRTLDEQPSLADKFRHIKHHLNVLRSTAGLKVFAFTAPHSKAGVSTLASNVSLVMAWDFLDQRILLVDSQVRRPVLHSAFGVQPHPGLLDYLLNGHDLSQVCQPTFRPNLDLITLGETPDVASSPFDLKRFGYFLEDVRRQYDFVIMDCPPVLEASDSQVICQKVDGVVVIVEANRLRYEVLTACLDELSPQSRLVGYIFNKRQFFIPDFLYRFV